MSRVVALRAASRAIGEQVVALHRAGVGGDVVEALRRAARACDEAVERETLAGSTRRAQAQPSLEWPLRRSLADLEVA